MDVRRGFRRFIEDGGLKFSFRSTLRIRKKRHAVELAELVTKTAKLMQRYRVIQVTSLGEDFLVVRNWKYFPLQWMHEPLTMIGDVSVTIEQSDSHLTCHVETDMGVMWFWGLLLTIIFGGWFILGIADEHTPRFELACFFLFFGLFSMYWARYRSNSFVRRHVKRAMKTLATPHRKSRR